MSLTLEDEFRKLYESEGATAIKAKLLVATQLIEEAKDAASQLGLPIHIQGLPFIPESFTQHFYNVDFVLVEQLTSVPEDALFKATENWNSSGCFEEREWDNSGCSFD